MCRKDQCRHFFLHKFRHTFATEHLRHGVDIRTLQSWMGHRDIKSTMVYLKGVNRKTHWPRSMLERWPGTLRDEGQVTRQANLGNKSLGKPKIC